MKISTAVFQKQWLTTIQDQQSALAALQRQISSGKRVSTASDDPLGAAQIVKLQQGLDRLDTYATNADTAQRRLNLEESTLDKVGDSLDRVRELAIQAGGAAGTKETRTAIADEAQQILTNLLDLANTQDGEGRFLFSGNLVHNQPFSVSGGSVGYFGDNGVRSERIGDNRTVQEGDPGSEVFQKIRNGNGTFFVEPDTTNAGAVFYSSAVVTDVSAWVPDDYTVVFTGTGPFTYEVQDGTGTAIANGAFTPGDTINFQGAAVTFDGQPADGDTFSVSASRNQDIFKTVQNFVVSLQRDLQAPSDSAIWQSNLNSSLLDIDNALENLGIVRSRVGARLSTIDQQLSTNSDVSLQLSESIGSVRDVDYASAISELESRLFGLEAAQKTFQSIRSFSLFDLI